MEETIDILQKALDRWGKELQVNLAIEEMGELIVALNHFRRGRVGIEAVCEEIADVAIAMEQLTMICGPDKVDRFYSEKLARLKVRLEN